MTGRPTGMVTFLLTDIEGSTRRWEAHPDLMSAAFARQESILWEAVAAYVGWVYKQVGDAFQVAFQTAPAALAAALAAQQALAAELWPPAIGPVRVRMALHTGSAEERGDDYVGPPLYHAHRLLSAGHGGQVLLTTTTQDLVRNSLPPGVVLRDLGERHLKDLAHPEHIWQATGPGLPADFPPLKTLDTRPNNLPMTLTALIGRATERAHAEALFAQPDVRLLTVTGPPGVGKTRFSLQLGVDLLPEFPDGVWFIALAAVEDADLLTATIAGTLGLRQEPGRPLLPSLLEHLRGQQVLLILDNFEQVTEGASLVSDLLGSVPGLKVLVTSRARLHLRGEKEFALVPLTLPAADPRPALDALARIPAVALFVERAADIQPGFTLTPDNAGAVAAICRRLDGLPLAIELAAARSKILAPPALLARLESRLPLLTGGAGDLAAHQQTLRETITWSYNLLGAAEQQLFRQLAVFAGGFTLAAAEVVCGAPAATAAATGVLWTHAARNQPVPDVLDRLTALLDQSLLQSDPGEEARFRMLETIREYAWDRLVASGEAAAIHQRHAAYFQALAEAADAGWQGTRQAVWRQRLAAEHDNLRAALAWAQETAQWEPGARLAGALTRFWATHGYLAEGRRWLEWALQAPPTLPVADRARLLDGASEIAYWQADYAAARAWAEETLALRRTLGHPAPIAEALTNLGRILWRLGDRAGAQALLAESQALRRASGAAPPSAETQRHPSGDPASET
jgi:predicted ATPase/class 3 adenylate cyclase